MKSFTACCGARAGSMPAARRRRARSSHLRNRARFAPRQRWRAHCRCGAASGGRRASPSASASALRASFSRSMPGVCFQLAHIAFGERCEPCRQRAALQPAREARALGTLSVARGAKGGRCQFWSLVQRQMRGAADAGAARDFAIGQRRFARSACGRPRPPHRHAGGAIRGGRGGRLSGSSGWTRRRMTGGAKGLRMKRRIAE